MVRLAMRSRSVPAVEAPAPSSAPVDLSRELIPGPLGDDEQAVTDLLYRRLSLEVVQAVEHLVADSPELQGWRLDTMEPGLRRWMVVQLGMWLKVPEVAEQTRLPLARPPEDVHAMARGPLAAAGGTYEADLVVAALRGAGASIDEAGAALDFGCSSGRVVWVLAAAHPEVEWRGCDPNEPAIAWARKKLPGIDFFVSGGDPPLPIEESSLGLVFAISIWSHFEPSLGLRWFAEMRRVIRPGGHLIVTTHGLTSVAHAAAVGLRSPEQLDGIVRSLYRRGWWYRAEFGDEGDWGVVDPRWGTAFVSPEWLLAELCPEWRVLQFAAGRNQGNQDVYVFERV